MRQYSHFQDSPGHLRILANLASVARATEEQAASFEEITASVTEMNGLVVSTAKDALNSSATAEEALTVVIRISSIITEINEVAGTTTQEMSRFKISLIRSIPTIDWQALS